MAKVKVMDSARELEARAKQLFERIKGMNADMSATLEDMRQYEGKLIEKEKIAEKERAEALRIERLRELANSADTAAYHSDEPETAEPEKPKAEEKSEASAIKSAEPEKASAEPKAEEKSEPAEQKAESAKGTAKPEQTKEELKKEEKANEVTAPVQQKNQEKPRQRANDANRPQQGGYQQRTIPQGNRTDKPQQQRGDRPQQRTDRPQRDGYQPLQGQDARPPRGEERFGKQQQRNDRPQQGQRRERPMQAASELIQPASGGRERGYEANKKAPAKGNRDDERRKNKKTLLKEAAPSMNAWDDDGGFGGRKKKRQAAPAPKPEPVKIEKAVINGETITVKELSEKIGKPAAEIIKKLFILGIMATINQEIDFDTCSLIASDYGIELEQNIAKTYEDVLLEGVDEDKDENLVERPPVVTIMGHVDHGKTSLLDAIRHSSITEGEAGGITQHIGAYTVTCNGRQITFIDTPGHEAFTAMRARGAQVTDIVILVVAADDGIMPQTVESINHAKAANIPVVVAINKMDAVGANPERIKQQLTEYDLVSEEWGGDTIVCPISAKTGQGIDNLLENLAVLSEVLELKANPNRAAKGAVIEARLDKGRGPIMTVLVQNGTLKLGDIIIAGTAVGRVRTMINDKGQRVTEAGPSTPVEISGMSEVPSAGDTFNAVADERMARELAEERRIQMNSNAMPGTKKVSLEDLFSQIQAGEMKTLNVIVKADVQGSAEAVKASLEKISNEEVRVKVIHSAVGAINESDVMLAATSGAIIVGFNVRPDNAARDSAARSKVDMRMYRVIYDCINEIEAAMKGMLAPKFKEAVIGHAEVRETYKVSKVGTVCGCYCTDGKIQRGCEVRVLRDNIVIHEGELASLRRFKDDVKEVASGYECGMQVEKFNDIKVGDVIECFVMEQINA